MKHILTTILHAWLLWLYGNNKHQKPKCDKIKFVKKMSKPCLIKLSFQTQDNYIGYSISLCFFLMFFRVNFHVFIKIIFILYHKMNAALAVSGFDDGFMWKQLQSALKWFEFILLIRKLSLELYLMSRTFLPWIRLSYWKPKQLPRKGSP